MAKNPREPLREGINKNRDGKDNAATKVRVTPSSGETPESSAIIPDHKPSGPGYHKEASSDGERGEHPDPYTKRATEAAETQAEYARWQAWGGVAGAIVGGLAAIFTGWAAYEAARAARAAVRATDIAEMSLTNIEAPFIFPVFDFPEIEYGPAKIKCVETARMRLKNFGKTPGVVSQFHYRCVIDDAIPKEPDTFPAGPASFYAEIIEAGGYGNPMPVGFLRRNWNGTRWSPSIGDYRFIIGLIRYSDVNGNQFICGFFYSMNPSNWSFSPIGGKKFNYRRKLTDEEIKAAENNLSEKPAIG